MVAIATSYAYPVKVEGRYVMDPSPIPKFDNPKLTMDAIQLFGAGREQRIYALPPHTQVVSLDFEDHPFDPSKADHACDLCGSDNQLSGRGDHRRQWAGGCLSVPTPTTAAPAASPWAIKVRCRTPTGSPYAE